MDTKDDIFSVNNTEIITLTSVASKALRDILTCQICKKVVYNSVQLPVCAHRFCLPCVASIKKECPICHKRYSKNPKNLKKDIYVDSIVRTLFPSDIKERPVTEEDMKLREIQYIKESLLHSTAKWPVSAQRDYISKVDDEINSFGDVYPVRKFLTLCKCPQPLVCVRRKITKEGSANKGKYFYGCPKYGKNVGETCNKFSILKEGNGGTPQKRTGKKTTQRGTRTGGGEMNSKRAPRKPRQRKRSIPQKEKNVNKRVKTSLLDFFSKSENEPIK